MNSGLCLKETPFVAEIAPDLVHPLVPAHQQPLQVKLEGDAQEEVLVELVVVGRKGRGCCPAVDGLQHGRLDLQEAALVEERPQCAHDGRPGDEDRPHLRVDGQVGVALAVACFLIGEGAVNHALAVDHLFLGCRQRGQRLGEHPEGRYLERDLTRTCAEHAPGGLDEIAQVEELGENLHPFLAHLIQPDEKLEAAAAVLDMGEGHLAHLTHRS